jgi:hypothetical protein
LHAAVENQETTSDSSESTDDSETSSDNDSSDKEEGKYICVVNVNAWFSCINGMSVCEV